MTVEGMRGLLEQTCPLSCGDAEWHAKGIMIYIKKKKSDSGLVQVNDY